MIENENEYVEISGIAVRCTPKKLLFDDGDQQIYIDKTIIQGLENSHAQYIDFDDVVAGEDVTMQVPYDLAYDKGLI